MQEVKKIQNTEYSYLSLKQGILQFGINNLF